MLLSVRWICEDLDILCAELEITSVGRTGWHSVYNSTDNVCVEQMKLFSGRVLVSVCQLVGVLCSSAPFLVDPTNSVGTK